MPLDLGLTFSRRKLVAMVFSNLGAKRQCPEFQSRIGDSIGPRLTVAPWLPRMDRDKVRRTGGY